MAEPYILPATKTRTQLAERIGNDQVRHYPFAGPASRSGPETYWRDGCAEELVTARTQELCVFGLAELLPAESGRDWQRVQLTDAGREWLHAATAAEAKRLGKS